MDWKKEAQSKLENYPSSRRAIHTMALELHRLELEQEGLKSPRLDGSRVRGNTHDREDRMLSNMALRHELRLRMEAMEVWVRAVESALQGLDQEDQLVLRRFYLEPGGQVAEDLCEKLCVERAAVYRRRDRALRRFAREFYGEA